MTLTFEWALTLCISIFLISTIISTKTNSKLPTMLTMSFIFLVGFWTVLPQDIIEISGIKTIYNICFLVVLIHVGAMFEMSKLKKDWRLALVVLTAVLAITILVGVIATVVFGKEIALCSIPPLTGGGISGIIMMNAANEKGYTQAALLAMMIMTLQIFIGSVLTGFNLRKEAVSKLKIGIQNGNEHTDIAEKAEKETIIEKIPEKYRDTTFHLFTCCLLGALAYLLGDITSGWTGGIVNKSILAIVFGILAKQFGIIEANPLEKSGSYPFLMMGLYIGIMDNLKMVTPSMLIETFIPFVGVFVISTIGIWFLCPLVGKKMNFTAAFSRAIGFNCFLGYPFNHQITIESINAVTNDPEERKYLEKELLPPMILAGVIAISVVSVLVAGIVSGLL